MGRKKLRERDLLFSVPLPLPPVLPFFTLLVLPTLQLSNILPGVHVFPGPITLQLWGELDLKFAEWGRSEDGHRVHLFGLLDSLRIRGLLSQLSRMYGESLGFVRISTRWWIWWGLRR